MPRITPNLWFDTEGHEAAEFYVSVFPNSKITDVTYYGEAGPGPAGTVLTVDFVLDGQPYTAINGGPQFTFDEAISLLVNCADQEGGLLLGRSSPMVEKGAVRVAQRTGTDCPGRSAEGDGRRVANDPDRSAQRAVRPCSAWRIGIAALRPLPIRPDKDQRLLLDQSKEPPWHC
jgi:hypothetical protein